MPQHQQQGPLPQHQHQQQQQQSYAAVAECDYAMHHGSAALKCLMWSGLGGSVTRPRIRSWVSISSLHQQQRDMTLAACWTGGWHLLAADVRSFGAAAGRAPVLTTQLWAPADVHAA
jgi:hypothetical protein